MIHEMQTPVDISIVMLPVIAHFALLIGFSVWSFIDDSHNKYAKWVYEKVEKTTAKDWEAGNTFGFLVCSALMAALYLVVAVILLGIHPLAPYVLAGFIAMMVIARSLRRLQKVVTEHINDKKIHKGGK